MGWYYVKPDLIILTLMWRWLIFEVIWNLAQNTIASEIRTFAHRAHLWWTACKKNTALISVFIDKVYVNQHLRQYWKRNLYLVWVFTFSTLNTISHIQTENGVKFWYIWNEELWKLIGERKIDSIKSRTHAWIWICSKLFLWYSKYLAKNSSTPSRQWQFMKKTRLDVNVACYRAIFWMSVSIAKNLLWQMSEHQNINICSARLLSEKKMKWCELLLWKMIRNKRMKPSRIDHQMKIR